MGHEVADRSDPSAGPSDDRFLGGRLTILQPRRGHRSGHDAVLLSAAVPEEAGGALVDLGAGVGVAGLCAAVRAAGLGITLVDKDCSLLRLASRNAERNGLAGRVRILALDIAEKQTERAKAGLVPASADIVILNPPFHQERHRVPSPQPERREAHHEGASNLEAWLRAAVSTARPGGRVTLIHLPEALPRLLAGLEGRLGAISLLPVLPRSGRPAIRLIVSGIRASRAPMRVLPALILEDEAGRPSPEASSLLRGERGLDLA